MKVGIQGGRGSFNEQAFHAFVERGDVDAQAHIDYLFTTKSVLESLSEGSIDYGVFAIYNSRSHLVTETAQVIGHYHFDVVAYITIPIQHHVMIHPDNATSEYDTIMGHEEAIAQCRNTLDERFASKKIIAGEGVLKDGAGVAEAIINGDMPMTTAVISGQATAEAFGLTVIADNLADDSSNATTFLLVRSFDG